MNRFTAEQKLDMAIDMAKSLTDIHEMPEGIVVHGDYHPDQYLTRKNDGNRMVLGDFNNAVILKQNITSGHFCPFHTGGHGWGNFLAPEYYLRGGSDVNESSDIFAYGNTLYGLLTGLYIFYDTDSDKEMRERLRNGILPAIDPRYRTRSYIEGRLVQIIEQCWSFSPARRPSASQILEYLLETKKQYLGGRQ